MHALTISKKKQEQIIKISSNMCEKQKRQYLASEAQLLGYGGVSLISRITGVSPCRNWPMVTYLSQTAANGLPVTGEQAEVAGMMNWLML